MGPRERLEQLVRAREEMTRTGKHPRTMRKARDAARRIASHASVMVEGLADKTDEAKAAAAQGRREVESAIRARREDSSPGHRGRVGGATPVLRNGGTELTVRPASASAVGVEQVLQTVSGGWSNLTVLVIGAVAVLGVRPHDPPLAFGADLAELAARGLRTCRTADHRLPAARYRRCWAATTYRLRVNCTIIGAAGRDLA